ncbi:ABC transporter substrate-binding protein, partial [Candidatus Glomeribacter gigasporarum]|uniref:ABC transporter substrate-binding protein n=1 Tax=Candidatus Glomeribacter gigasporarum TaxID=132144 RepID=UPI000C7B4461
MKFLTYCAEASPKGFDPGRSEASTEFTLTATVFNRLLEYNRTNINKIEPSLAEKWDISPDGRVYTFYLRRNVKFHTTPWFKPTRDLNAEDVVFTFERMRNPNIPFRKAYPTEFPEFQGLETVISKIEAPDLYTVRFALNTVYAPFLSKLVMPFASIVSAEYAQQLLEKGKPSEINQKPVGTGPFIFRKYDKDSTLVFDGNLEYWKPEDVRLSRLIFAITPDAAVRAQKLIKNECQVSAVPRSSDIAMLRKVPHLRVLSQSGFSMGYLAYNMTHPPLDDVRVRRALDTAIDKKTIIDAVYGGGGHAKIAVSLMPPMQWSYNKTLQDTPRDLKQAKELLAQAGYPNGFTLSLWAMSEQRPYNPNARLMAQMIQADWEKIGV